jgi:DNA invertase Pin-like site-specific DNA recombinase
MTNVYAYIRVSTVRQGIQGSSLQEQKSVIEQYATQNKLDVIEWFEERETAAKSGRPVFNRMLKRLKKGRIKGVIIHKIDRSARNLVDWVEISALVDHGLDLHIAHENLDLKTRGGRLCADIQAIIAADFSRNQRDEIRKGMRGRFKQGLYPVRAPIGYLDQGKGKPKTLDPLISPLVEQVFELYATGNYTLYQLGRAAYQLGLRNRGGRRVTRNGLSTILNNEFYIGILHLSRTGERFTGKHEPLISAALFERVQRQLQARRVQRNIKHDFLFRLFLRCRHCGYHLRGELHHKTVYYRCHERTCPSTCVREDAVTEQAQAKLQEIVSQLANHNILLSEISRELERRKAHSAEQIRKARLRLQSIEERLARLTDGYLEQKIDEEVYLDRQHHILKERASAREVLDALISHNDPAEAEAKAFSDRITEIYRDRGIVGREGLREILKSITSKIQIDQKRLILEWNEPYAALFRRNCIESIPTHDARLRRSNLPPVESSQDELISLVKELFHAFEQMKYRGSAGNVPTSPRPPLTSPAPLPPLDLLA